MKGSNTWIIVAIFVVAAFLWVTGSLAFLGPQFAAPSFIVPTQGGGSSVVQTGPGYATTVKGGAVDVSSGAAATVCSELLDNAGTIYQSNASTTGPGASISTAMPNTFNGYEMIGNDNGAASIDCGTEYYLQKMPFSYTNQGIYTIPQAPAYAESTALTVTGYDDGASEATINITVGTSDVTSSELKIETAAGTVFGNPQITNPIAVCFNATAANAAYWKVVAPLNYISSFTMPNTLIAGVQLGCYVLPTGAIGSNVGSLPSYYRFYYRLSPASDPVGTVAIDASFWDATYYLNDQNQWTTGFYHDTQYGTKSDIGMATPTETTINFG